MFAAVYLSLQGFAEGWAAPGKYCGGNFSDGALAISRSRYKAQRTVACTKHGDCYRLGLCSGYLSIGSGGCVAASLYQAPFVGKR